jgi:hypothetical protein
LCVDIGNPHNAQGNHWQLLIYNRLDNTLTYYCSYDQHHAHHSMRVTALITSLGFDTPLLHHVHSPRQTDDSSCGPYILNYARQHIMPSTPAADTISVPDLRRGILDTLISRDL